MNCTNKSAGICVGQPAPVKTASFPPSPSQSHQSLSNIESWFGFVKDKADAVMLVEAVIAGSLKALKMVPASAKLRSGSVVIFAESHLQTQMTRWRDGESWSPSRIQGPFLLYREVESTKGKSGNGASQAEAAKCRFSTTSMRPNSRLVANGFAKRTITIVGSDNTKYRVISYFFPDDVAYLYGDVVTVTRQAANDRRRLNDGVRLMTPSQSPLFSLSPGNSPAPSMPPPTPYLGRPLEKDSRKRSYESIHSEFSEPAFCSPKLVPGTRYEFTPCAEFGLPDMHDSAFCVCGGLDGLSPLDYYGRSAEFWDQPILLNPIKKCRLDL
ncbi:hypothetical protein HDU84_000137 [Entophlyctis sp. JEL0112]|nr:hypothetical protein HDU84_000137 [Entophlyctis sp. JEL0112]